MKSKTKFRIEEIPYLLETMILELILERGGRAGSFLK